MQPSTRCCEGTSTGTSCQDSTTDVYHLAPPIAQRFQFQSEFREAQQTDSWLCARQPPLASAERRLVQTLRLARPSSLAQQSRAQHLYWVFSPCGFQTCRRTVRQISDQSRRKREISQKSTCQWKGGAHQVEISGWSPGAPESHQIEVRSPGGPHQVDVFQRARIFQRK